MSIPSSFIQELRSRVSIVSVVSQSVKLKRRGNEYWGCCPFHREKTPSFTVSDEREYFHCFGCGVHGSVFDFVQRMMGISFLEAVEYLAHYAGMEVPKPQARDSGIERKKKGILEALEAAASFFEDQLKKTSGQSGLRYLRIRGLSDEIIRKFRLGFAPFGNMLKEHMLQSGFNEDILMEAGLLLKSGQDNETFDYFKKRVMFPIFDRHGKVIAFGGRITGDGEPKYLNSPETSVFSKGDNLYALHFSAEQARKTGEIIVVEGYMDVIAMASVGIERAVAPLGTALTPQQIQLLWRYAPEPLCCFDGDKAGQRAAQRAADRALPLLKAGCSLRFVTLPDNQDPDEYIKKYGKEAFENFLQTQYRPLFKQLWQTLIQGRSLDTPERKAALNKSILECLDKIQDPVVKNFYRQEFKTSLWEITSYQKRQSNVKNFSYSKNNKKQDVPIHPVLSPQQHETRMLLAYVLLFPEIVSDFVEECCKWKGFDDYQNKVFSDVINLIVSDPDVCAQNVKEYLTRTDQLKIYDLLSAEIEMLNRKKAYPQNIHEDIAALLTGMTKRALRAEMQSLAEKITRADDNEAHDLWEKYQNLLKEETSLA